MTPHEYNIARQQALAARIAVWNGHAAEADPKQADGRLGRPVIDLTTGVRTHKGGRR